MRKFLIIFLLLASLTTAQAQKYACVNTDYIMRSVPEYNQALAKINKFIAEWQQELQNKQQEVDELRQQYQQEAYLLPDNLKQRRQDEIHNKESELRSLQQKRAELMKPVQDRVYNAIERVAREKNYAFVFDKSASATVLYVSEKYDISNLVLEMLGVKPGATSETGGMATPNGGARNDKGSSSDQGAGKQQGSARKEQPRKY